MKILLFTRSAYTNYIGKIIDSLEETKDVLLGVIGDRGLCQLLDNKHIKYLGDDYTQIVDLASQADLAISWLYDKKIKEPFISTPKFGCINFHPAPLPDYRGSGGCNLAILNKVTEWGGTVHCVDEKFDEGDIIRKKMFPIDYRKETAYSLKQKTNDALYELFEEILREIHVKKVIKGEKQDLRKGLFYRKKDVLELMKIDLENDDVDTKIQAFWFPPYEGAYIEVGGKHYTLVNDVVLNSLAEKK